MTLKEQLENVSGLSAEQHAELAQYINGVIGRGKETEFGNWVEFRIKELETMIRNRLYQVDDNARRALRLAGAFGALEAVREYIFSPLKEIADDGTE